jgi:hypothetical protein
VATLNGSIITHSVDTDGAVDQNGRRLLSHMIYIHQLFVCKCNATILSAHRKVIMHSKLLYSFQSRSRNLLLFFLSVYIELQCFASVYNVYNLHVIRKESVCFEGSVRFRCPRVQCAWRTIMEVR